jgi:hypothetical protein
MNRKKKKKYSVEMLGERGSQSGSKLSPAEFFVCVCLKAEMYGTCPAGIRHLKQQIRQYIEAIPKYFCSVQKHRC